MFFCHFYTGNTFCDLLFASLDNKWSLLLQEEIWSKRSKFFPLRIGQHLENGRVASTE